MSIYSPNRTYNQANSGISDDQSYANRLAYLWQRSDDLSPRIDSMGRPSDLYRGYLAVMASLTEAQHPYDGDIKTRDEATGQIVTRPRATIDEAHRDLDALANAVLEAEAENQAGYIQLDLSRPISDDPYDGEDSF